MSKLEEKNTIQAALRHGPGRFRTALTFKLLPTESPAQGLESLALLLKELEAPELADKPLTVLVAVAPPLLRQHPSWPALSSEHVTHPLIEDEQSDAFVQIAAETEDQRTFALRLVRRVLRPSFELGEQIHGGERLFNTEAFGYRHSSSWETPSQIPTSRAAIGVSWLLFQPCIQDLDAFFDESLDRQDAIVGRPRPHASQTEGTPGSHMAHARAAQGDPERLLRRSFAYECYEEAGLAFIASASHSGHLTRALDALKDDPLSGYMSLRPGGLFVVPPCSEWLAPEAQLEPRTGQMRPGAERTFFPEHPLVLYEVTPKSKEFFWSLFHENKDHIDDETGQLRSDLEVVTRLLAKLLFGGRLTPENRFRRLCEIASIWDTSEPLSEGAAQQAERLGRALLNAEGPEEVARLSTSLKAILLPRAEIKAGALSRITVAELIADLMYDDALYMSGRSEAARQRFAELPALWKVAAAEARAANAAVGEYMTFVP